MEDNINTTVEHAKIDKAISSIMLALKGLNQWEVKTVMVSVKHRVKETSLVQ